MAKMENEGHRFSSDFKESLLSDKVLTRATGTELFPRYFIDFRGKYEVNLTKEPDACRKFYEEIVKNMKSFSAVDLIESLDKMKVKREIQDLSDLVLPQILEDGFPVDKLVAKVGNNKQNQDILDQIKFRLTIDIGSPTKRMEIDNIHSGVFAMLRNNELHDIKKELDNILELYKKSGYLEGIKLSRDYREIQRQREKVNEILQKGQRGLQLGDLLAIDGVSKYDLRLSMSLNYDNRLLGVYAFQSALESDKVSEDAKEKIALALDRFYILGRLMGLKMGEHNLLREEKAEIAEMFEKGVKVVENLCAALKNEPLEPIAMHATVLQEAVAKKEAELLKANEKTNSVEDEQAVARAV
jgi:hypothetical protein